MYQHHQWISVVIDPTFLNLVVAPASWAQIEIKKNGISQPKGLDVANVIVTISSLSIKVLMLGIKFFFFFVLEFLALICRTLGNKT